MLSSRIALASLASILLVGKSVGFTASSSPLFRRASRTRPMTPGDEIENRYAAPSHTPNQLSFALSNDEGLSPISRRGGGERRQKVLESRKKQWIDRSWKYYSTVMREEKRRRRGQLPAHPALDSPEERRHQIELAQKHYFALRKIKSGQLDHAELIYRRIIDELKGHDDGCDHAKLAVSTLLLALLLQRRGDVKGTRSCFLQFFKVAVLENDDEEKECACSAKVLQAYALFEMKRGHGRKSLEIVEKAVQMDKELRPVLEWKQFREVMGQMESSRLRP